MLSLPASEGRATRLQRYDRPLTCGQGVELVHATLAGWGLDGDSEQAMDAVLVAGELLANAQQHADGIEALEIAWHDTSVRIAVSDTNPRPPRLTWLPRAPRLRGHGLYLVERLSIRWGSDARPDGKTVWADLRCPRSARARPASGPRTEAPAPRPGPRRSPPNG